MAVYKPKTWGNVAIVSEHTVNACFTKFPKVAVQYYALNEFHIRTQSCFTATTVLLKVSLFCVCVFMICSDCLHLHECVLLMTLLCDFFNLIVFFL